MRGAYKRFSLFLSHTARDSLAFLVSFDIIWSGTEMSKGARPRCSSFVWNLVVRNRKTAQRATRAVITQSAFALSLSLLVGSYCSPREKNVNSQLLLYYAATSVWWCMYTHRDTKHTHTYTVYIDSSTCVCVRNICDHLSLISAERRPPIQIYIYIYIKRCLYCLHLSLVFPLFRSSGAWIITRLRAAISGITHVITGSPPILFHRGLQSGAVEKNWLIEVHE